MKDNILKTKLYKFALRMIKLLQYLSDEQKNLYY
jgi:hypothetical protein